MSKELKPCPFCKFEPSADQPDCVYPVTPDRVVWALHCYETGGGCGAQVLGESADDCIERWNRRAQPAEAEGVEVVAWLNTATEAVTVHPVQVMDWDDESEPVEPLVRQSDHLAAMAAKEA